MKHFISIIATGLSVGCVVYTGMVSIAHAISPVANHGTIITDGYLQSDTLWNKAHSPYILSDVVTVSKGLTLTIEPGTEVVPDPTSQYDPYIYVAGNLIIKGTSDSHIGIRGIWGLTIDHGQVDISFADISMKGRLMFDGSSGRIATSTISNSVDGVYSDGIFISNSVVTITGSTIEHNVNGVVVKDSSPVFQVRGFRSGLFVFIGQVLEKIGLIKTVHAEAPPSVVTISGSRIINNLQNSLRNNASVSVNAENNWWGSINGPTVQGGISQGIGNSIQGRASFIPWLDHDPMGDEVSIACCSSIVFLPGLEASRLYRPDTGVLMDNRLWEPNRNDDVRKLFLNSNGTSIDPAAYAGLPIGQAFGFVDIYGSFMTFMDGLVKKGAITEWRPFGYDWRKPINEVVQGYTARATTTESLILLIEDIATRSKTGKVTLIAHSNGGLVAKYLVKTLADMGKASLIDSVISVAVPYLGTPQAIAGLLEGDNQSILGGLILRRSVAKELGINMPSAYSLLPSSTYFTKVFGPTIAYASGTSSPVTTVDAQSAFIDSRANAVLMAAARTLHAVLDPFVWPEAIHRWALVGWGNKTTKAVVYGAKGYSATTTIMGDGTVVVPSASYNSGTTTALNLPIISKDEGRTIDHANILGSDAVQSSIESIITHDSDTNNTRSIEDKLASIRGVAVGDFDFDMEKTFVIVSTHSPVELHIYDAKGRHTGVAPLPTDADEDIEEGLFTYIEKNVPGSSIDIHGDDNPETYISLPDDTGQTYSVNIKGTGVGEFTYMVQRVRGGDVLDSAVYSSLPVTPLMTATTTLSTQATDLPVSVGIASTSSQVSIDIDGDGSSDMSVSANKAPDPISFLELLKKTVQKISDSSKRTKDIIRRIDRIEGFVLKGKNKKVIGATASLKKKVLHKKAKALSFADKQEILDLIDSFLAQFE